MTANTKPPIVYTVDPMILRMMSQQKDGSEPITCDTKGVCVCVCTYLVIVLTVNWEGGCVSCINSCRYTELWSRAIATTGST